MGTTKKPFSARISDLTRKLIDCEQEENGGSEADAIERLAIRAAAGSPKATQLVLEHLDKDPRSKAIVALAMRESGFSDGDSKAKQKR